MSRVLACTFTIMDHQAKTGNDQLLVVLKASLNEIGEKRQKHDQELADIRKKHDELKVELRQLGGTAQAPKKTIFGWGQSISKIPKIQEEITKLSGRIEMLRHMIQDCDNEREKVTDDHLLATDDHYRIDSMRWNAVVRFKHCLELYSKATDRAAILVNGIRSTEASREESGLRERSNQELLEHPDFPKSIDQIKEGYDAYGKAVEDMLAHYGDKVACSITITYHGGSLKFDVYKHPESLSLYKIESLEEALFQMDGLKRSIKAVLAHVENLYNATTAERLRYHNRLKKSLSA